MIYRTWICLNRNCLHENTVADVEYPPCPRCGSLKVKWVPRTTGIISARTQSIDRTVRDLSRNAYGDRGDKNWNSPRRGERAAPKVNPPMGSYATQFAPKGMPGWAGTIPVDPQTGSMLPACVNTPVTARLPVQLGTANAGNAQMHPVPQVDPRHHFGTPADIRRG